MRPPAAPSQSIVDLEGASGALYRFRQVPNPDMLPASGGNFVCIRQEPRGMKVVCCGSASDLRHAAQPYEAAVRLHLADSILVRLNISGAVRDREHDDLVARHQPPLEAAGAQLEP